MLALDGWNLGDLNAILIKELRQELRVRSFVYTFTWFHLALIVLTVASVAVRSTDLGLLGSNVLFWCILGVPLCLVIPIRALAAFNKETTANELELVFLTRLSSWQLVVFKWLALCLQGFLLVTAALPYVIIRYVAGSLNPLDALHTLGVLLLLMLLLSAATIRIAAWRSRHSHVSGLIWIVGILLALPILNSVFGFFLYFAFGFRGRLWPGYTGAMDTILTLGSLALLVLALLLEAAAASIAPRAENHACVKRLFGLAAIGAGCILLALDMQPELVVASLSIYLLVICLSALGEAPNYAQSLYAPFVQSGAWRRVVGALCYPGWCSGVLYTLFISAVAWMLTLAFEIAPGYELLHMIGTAVGILLFSLILANACGRRLTWLFFLISQLLLLGVSFVFVRLDTFYGWSGTYPAFSVTDYILSALPVAAFTFGTMLDHIVIVPWVMHASFLAILLLLSYQWLAEWRRVLDVQARTRQALARRVHHG